MDVPSTTSAVSAVQQSLLIMAEGMAGIFAFMAIFYGLINLLNFLFRPKTKDQAA